MFDLESRPVIVNPFLSLLKQHVSRLFASRRTHRRKARKVLPTRIEQLEERSLLSANIPIDPTGQLWSAIGPAPLVNGPVSNTSGGLSVSGRATGIAPHPTNASIIYLATAGGGVWKTIDAGVNWAPLTDNIPNLRDQNNQLVSYFEQTLVMGAIAVSRSNPDVVYAGTGESNLSADSFAGRGILKSVDAGVSWVLLRGTNADIPANTREFDRRTTARIIVHPLNPNIVYAAINANGTNGLAGNAGIWKSIDGGQTWRNTTFNAPPSSSTPLSDNFDFSDLAMDSSDSETLYTAVNFGGQSTGLYKTTDGGDTWFRLSSFPTGANVGRMSIAVAPSQPNTVYVGITNNADVFLMEKTINGGLSWFNLPNTPNFTAGNPGQGFYDVTVIVDPVDPNVVYAGGAATVNSFIKTVNGGTSWIPISVGVNGFGPHVDHHATAFDANGKLLDANDGGLARLDNATAIQWTSLNGTAGLTALNTIQANSVDLDAFDPNVAFMASQDNGTARFFDSAGLNPPEQAYAWQVSRGGDGGRVRVDFSETNNIYHTFFNKQVERSTDRGLTWLNATPPAPIANAGVPEAVLFYAPLEMSPANSRNLFFGTNRLWESQNGGVTWGDVGVPADRASGGIWGDPPPVCPFSTWSGWDAGGDSSRGIAGPRITAIGPSSNQNIVYVALEASSSIEPVQPAILPAVGFATRIFVSNFRDGCLGSPNGISRLHWLDLTPSMPASIGTRNVQDILVDKQDPNTAYVVLDSVAFGANASQIYRVRNATSGTPIWDDISGDIPNIPVNTIEQDPRQFNKPDDILYVGTAQGVYTTNSLPITITSSTNWKSLGVGLPNAVVTELKLVKTLDTNSADILAAATYGRGIWEIASNPIPTLTNIGTLGPTQEDTSITITYDEVFQKSDAADPNGDNIFFRLDQVTSGTLTKNGQPVVAGSTRLGSGETWVWTPPPNQNTPLNGNQPLNAFTVRAFDLEKLSITPVQVRIDVTPVPDAPIVQINPILFSVAKNSTANPFTYAQITSVSGTIDPDEPPANVITYVVQTVPAGTLTKGGIPVIVGSTTVSVGETLEWSPPNGFQGSQIPAFTLRVRDNTLPAPLFAVSDLRVNIDVVNTAPVLTAVGTLAGALEDTLFDIPFATLQAAADDSDANGDPLSFRITGITAGHTLTLNGNPITTGVSLFAAGDTLNYQAPLNANGQLIGFTITAFDGNLGSSPNVPVSINVQPVNDAPTLTSVGQFLTSQDFPITLTYAQLAAAANEADVDGDTLNFVIGSALNGSSLNVSAGSILLPGQSVVWTPPVGVTGLVAGFQIQAIDPSAASSVPPANVPFNVVVNNAPTLTAIATLFGGKKNLPYTVTYAALQAAANESDIDVPAQTLSFVIQTVAASGSLTKNNIAVVPGSTTLGPGESLVFTPVIGTQSPPAIEMFTTHVTDGFSFSATDVPVNVQIDNTAPTLTTINTLTNATEDTAFNILYPTLAAAANEADADPSETLNFLISSLSSGSLLLNGLPAVAGTSVFHNGDTLTWTPPLNANGTLAAFTVRAFDGTALNTPAGALASTTSVQVNVSVAAMNDAPTLTTVNQFSGGVQGISFDFSYSALLAAADEADVDGDTILFRIEQVVSGTLTFNGAPVVQGSTKIGPNQKVTWTPPAGVTGSATAFTVRAFDGTAASASPVAVSLDLVTLPTARMFRAYNPNADYHFFTLSTLEFNSAVAHGYIDESTGRPGYAVATAQVNGTLAIHRLRNPYNGRHYYTGNTSERDFLTSIGWIFEKDEGFILTTAVTGSVEIFRLYNKNTGSHLYTESAATKNAVLAQFPGVWLLHTSLGFAFPSAASNNPPASAPARLAPALSEASKEGTESGGSPVGSVFATATTNSTGVDRRLTPGTTGTSTFRTSTARLLESAEIRSLSRTASVGKAKPLGTEVQTADQFWSDIGRQLQEGTAVGFDEVEVRRSRQ